MDNPGRHDTNRVTDFDIKADSTRGKDAFRGRVYAVEKSAIIL